MPSSIDKKNTTIAVATAAPLPAATFPTLAPHRPRGGGRDALASLLQRADKGRWHDPRQGKAPGGRPGNDRRAVKPAPAGGRGRR